MNSQKLKYYLALSVYFIISFSVILVQSTGLLTLQLDTASAVLILPLVIYGGYYFGEYSGAVLGLIMGAVTDAYSSTLSYNTVVLTVFGFASGLMISRLFNRNFTAAAVLNIGGSVLYFFVKWLIVYAFNDPAAGFVLLRFSLPSMLYTALLGVLMFFLLNIFLKKIPIAPTRR